MTDGKTEVIPADTNEMTTPAQVQESSLLSTIERIAANPEVDVDRIKMLLEMRASEEDRARRIQREDAAEIARRAFLRDFALVQQEVGPIAFDRANDHTRSRYATLAAIERQVTPVLTEHGFSTSASPAPCSVDGHIRVKLTIGHREGHERIYEDDFPLDVAGAKGTTNKTPIQAKGSTQTYGRRYLKASALDLAFFEDNDGNAPKDDDVPKISAEQFQELSGLLEPAGWSEDDLILAYSGTPGETLLAELPLQYFEHAKARLQALAVKREAAQ